MENAFPALIANTQVREVSQRGPLVRRAQPHPALSRGVAMRVRQPPFSSRTCRALHSPVRPALQELRALFASIEAAEAAVARVHGAAKAASDRLDALQKGYDTKYPEGLQARLGSWLGVRCVGGAAGGRRGGSGDGVGLEALLMPVLHARQVAPASHTRLLHRLFLTCPPSPRSPLSCSLTTYRSPKSALDAPVVLPPWEPDATRLDVGAEVAAMAAPLGDALARLRAAQQGAGDGSYGEGEGAGAGNDGHGGGGADAGEGADGGGGGESDPHAHGGSSSADDGSEEQQ